MRDSWAATGFEQRAPHGFVCTRRVMWELRAEEARSTAVGAAGLSEQLQLHWKVLQTAGGDGP
eukprot:scaffold194187_cov37-Tisochrysis_lutea.AAC.1